MFRASFAALLPALVFAQSSPRTFEAASIKFHEGSLHRINEITTSGQRLTAYAANAAYLIVYAYDVKAFQIEGIRDYDSYWDIFAKAEGDSIPTTAEFRQMLQALLADRFQLKMHREMREMPVYALVVAKNGPKLKDADPDTDAMGLFDQQGRNVVVTLPKASMSGIVDAIGYANLDRPIVDKTGLSGTYNIKLTYTPNFKRYNGSAPDVDDLDVFQAVEKQLGLKLEARKDSVEILVVDRVEKPSAN
jgi:uncharacterized protein (TIGR03435 family)